MSADYEMNKLLVTRSGVIYFKLVKFKPESSAERICQTFSLFKMGQINIVRAYLLYTDRVTRFQKALGQIDALATTLKKIRPVELLLYKKKMEIHHIHETKVHQCNCLTLCYL